jgi:L-amino acid N-acyltransferase YncA
MFSALPPLESGEAHGLDTATQSSTPAHVRHDVRGQGVGRALVEALFPRALAMGKHVMIGGIDAANDASIRFHERLGFERVAYFREVGHKFGHWLDLVFMQRFLDAPGTLRS